MHKVSRTLLLAGVLAFGTLSAACGDKVTVAGPATGVQLVTVTPPTANVTIGQSIILSGQVTADAASAKTVTWSTSNAAIATVDATGKVTGVSAGVVTITATSTADPSKSAGSSVTVGALTGGPVAPQISISTINQGGFPAQLGAIANQLDVTLLATGGAGKVDLFLSPAANCGSTTIVASDSLVATQNTPATQAGPITLSFNTAALNANSNNPKFLNGNYCIKSRITTATGTATAANTVPLTLANVSRYNGVFTFTKTTTLGVQNAINPAGLRFDQGDLTVTINPVNYAGGSPIATLAVSLSGAGKSLLLTPVAGTQTFTGTFGSLPATVVGSSIYQYQTTASAGDFLTVTASTDAAGQQSFLGAIGTGGVPTVIRIDNLSPNPIAFAAGPLSGPVAPGVTNFVNASFAFSSSITAGTLTGNDANNNFPVTTVFGYRLNDASFTALTGGVSISPVTCAQTGWTIVADPSTIPNSPYSSTPTQYRLREFQSDALGNVRCTDFLSTFGVDKELPTLSVTGPANNTVIVTGTSMTTAFADSISGFTLGSQVSYTDMRNFSTANCVYGTTANGCTIVGGPSIVIDNNLGTQAYYVLTAASVDQANNFSAPVSRVYLLDNTAPVVQGISIPQNLVGGVSQTFTSTATDNVDLQSSNFNIQYSALTGLNLYYAGPSYGPNYDATLVTSTAVNATVPFFIKQIQSTDAFGSPVALAPADSGEAASVTVRAIDAANLISIASTAAIPNINVSSSAGFTTGTEFNFFTETNAVQNVNNGTGTATTSSTLSAAAVLNSVGAQSMAAPFSQVCFYYQQTAAGAIADPTIPALTYVQVGCVAAPAITDVAGVSRTWTYQLSPAFNPPAALGTAGTVPIIAIGVRANGVGVVSPVNNNITLVN